MIRIWVKTIKENKIKKSVIYDNFLLLNKENFEQTILEVCHEIDEPVPVILNKHFNHFNEFNITEFKAGDFVESVNFDRMVVENALI